MKKQNEGKGQGIRALQDAESNFKWECLRKNKDYQEIWRKRTEYAEKGEWDKHMEYCGKIKDILRSRGLQDFNYEFPPWIDKDEGFYISPVAVMGKNKKAESEEIKEKLEKFTESFADLKEEDPEAYERKVEEFCLKISRNGWSEEEFLAYVPPFSDVDERELKWRWSPRRRLNKEGVFETTFLKNDRFLTIHIDLWQKKEAIMRDVGYMVNTLRKITPEVKLHTRTRFRPEDERCLKVWDLAQKLPNLIEVTKKLYPEFKNFNSSRGFPMPDYEKYEDRVIEVMEERALRGRRGEAERIVNQEFGIPGSTDDLEAKFEAKKKHVYRSFKRVEQLIKEGHSSTDA